MRFHKAIVILSFVLLINCKTVNTITKNIDKPMEIYLCIGQSNMAGRGAIEEVDRDTLKNVFLFTGNNIKPWEKAANPLNKYSTVRKKLSMQRLSPSYGFAKAMNEAQPNTKIGLVVNAKGGTSIEKWSPRYTLYNEAIKQTQKALKTGGILKGIIWHQGEANVSNYKQYMSKLIALIAAFRTDLNQPDLPFVAGQLSEDKSKRKHFNAMIINLPNTVSDTGIASSENTSTIDSTHFDSASQRLLGKRYAEEMLKLLND